jgi:hypothetical protein
MNPGGSEVGSQKSAIRRCICVIRVIRSLILVAEIFEIRGHAEVAAAHELNHSLEFIFLFSCDPNLSVLLVI